MVSNKWIFRFRNHNNHVVLSSLDFPNHHFENWPVEIMDSESLENVGSMKIRKPPSAERRRSKSNEDLLSKNKSKHWNCAELYLSYLPAAADVWINFSSNDT